MKRFPHGWTARAVVVAVGLQTFGGMAWAQQRPVISARPGERTPRPLPAASGEGIPLSLDQVLALALANNEDLSVSVNVAEASRYTLFQSQGIFDPLASLSATRSHAEAPAVSRVFGSKSDRLDVSAQVSELAPSGGVFSLGFTARRASDNSTFNVINPSFSSGLTLNLTQPLLKNFGPTPTTLQIRIARNSRDASYQTFVRSVQSTVNAVEQAYWDLVYTLRNLEVTKESLRIAQDLNRITKIKIDVGSLAPIDITQTEVGIAKAEQDIIAAEGAVGDAQDRLKRLMNFDPKRWMVPILPTDQVRVEDTAIVLEEGTKTALARRPEILAQAYTTNSKHLQYEYWKNQTLPKLDLVGSYGYSGVGGTTDPQTMLDIRRGFGGSVRQLFDFDFKNWSVGLNFSYPIGNRAARGARGAAQYDWEASKAQLSTIQQNILIDVRAALRAINTARRQIVAAQKGRELAEKNLDAEKKKFDNGMTTSFQVTQIQRDLSAARTAELQALAVYRKALAAYHFAIADILDWKGIRIEDIPETSPPTTDATIGTR